MSLAYAVSLAGVGDQRCRRMRRYGRAVSTNEWDRRYGTEDHPLWSGRANGVLIAEVAAAKPGRALDVGCGEGADAIWLASRGWRVTGLDVSRVALDRAAAAARLADVDVQWRGADISAEHTNTARYDVVSVLYPALTRSPDDRAVHALLDAVAPGGTLLVVGHAPLDPEYARAHGLDLADYVQVADVKEVLDDGWHVQSTKPGHGLTRCKKARRTRTMLCFAPSGEANPSYRDAIGDSRLTAPTSAAKPCHVPPRFTGQGFLASARCGGGRERIRGRCPIGRLRRGWWH